MATKRERIGIHGGGAGRGAVTVRAILRNRDEFRAGRPAPTQRRGTSIGAWIAMACAAGLEDKLDPLFRSINGKSDAMRLDLNPFDGDGLGWDLDRIADLAAAAGIGANMRVPTYVGVVDLREWNAPDNGVLYGHSLVRVDTLHPDDARMWAARSSCQRPFHKWVGPSKEDGPQWVDGGLAAPNPTTDLDPETVEEAIVYACSPMPAAARRERKTVDEVRSPLAVAMRVIDHIIDRNVALDLERMQTAARRGVKVSAYWPSTIADVRAPFDLSRETMVHRLDPAGGRYVKNRFGFNTTGGYRKG